jgi:uncharacterized membrane protein HdeD (DUF308 family)
MQENKAMAERTAGVVTELAADAKALCKRTWWTFLVGGIASVVFGILAFMNPGVALLVLSLFFASYLIIDGVVNVIGAITHREKDGWWALLTIGVISVAVGCYALFVPPVSMLALVYLVAFIAVMVGVSLISLGWKVRAVVHTEWLLYVTGVLSVLFGLSILFRPGIGSLSVVYMIASWAILIGALRIVIALRVRAFGAEAGRRIKSMRAA